MPQRAADRRFCCVPLDQVMACLRGPAAGNGVTPRVERGFDRGLADDRGYYEDPVFDGPAGPGERVGVKDPLVARPGWRPWRWRCRCGRRAKNQPAAGGTGVPELRTAGGDDIGARSPTLEALDERKRGLILEMRGRLDVLGASEAPPRRHDLWLKRFLQHGKWKLDKGMQLYLEMEAWRREVSADRILKDGSIVPMNRQLPIDLIGFYPYSLDRTGRTISWMRVGHVPWWRPLFEPLDEALRSQLWMGEYLDGEVERHARESGVWRERAVILVDLSHLDMAYFKGLAGSGRARRRGAMQSVAKYYPGIVDKAYIVHAPGFANRAWSMLKYFLSADLMAKAVMVASEAEKTEMIEALGAENTPVSLGGTSSAASMPLPPSLRMLDGCRCRTVCSCWENRLREWRPKEILVGARQRHEEVLLVPAGGRARWRWALTDSSCSFEVSRRQAGAEWRVVKPSQECTFFNLEDPQEGEVEAPAGGCEFQFVWDNTASMMRGRTLLLRLETF